MLGGTGVSTRDILVETALQEHLTQNSLSVSYSEPVSVLTQGVLRSAFSIISQEYDYSFRVSSQFLHRNYRRLY